MSKKLGNFTGKGYYKVVGAEPLAKKSIALRLPASVDKDLREIAGEDITGWLRRAIAKQIAEEKQSATTP